MEENTLFLDTMQGLLEAIAIDKGVIPMEPVPGMPADTLRASGSDVELIAIDEISTSEAVSV